MEMGRPYLRTHWVWLAVPGTVWPPANALFHPGIVAMNRVGLGGFLRSEGVHVIPVQSSVALSRAMKSGSGRVAAGQSEVTITDSITAGSFPSGAGLIQKPLPAGPAAEGIALGFWKGDTTLRNHIDAVLAEMAADGTLERFAAEYGLENSLMR